MLPKTKTFVAKTALARGSANNGAFKVKSIALRSALSATALRRGVDPGRAER